MSRTCPNCQSPILETQRFCRYCGFRLDEGLQDYVETNVFDQTAASGGYQTRTVGHSSWSPPMPESTTTLETRRRRSFLLFGLLSLVLVAALGVGGFFIFSGSGPRWLPFSRGGSAVGMARSFIGVYFADDGRNGALIEGIATEGGPADVAGLVGGDLIVEANGRPIRSQDEMRQLLSSVPPGSHLKLKFLRDGQEMETSLVTAARGDFAEPPMEREHGYFGIETDNLKRVYIPKQKIWGVRLDGVLTNRPANVAGIRNGDIVIEFNGHPIRSPRELIRRIRETGPYSVVEVKVVRGDEEVVFPMKMGSNE